MGQNRHLSLPDQETGRRQNLSPLKAQRSCHQEKVVLADAAGSHSLVPYHHPPLTRQFWGNLPLLFKPLTLPFQPHIAVRQPEPKISTWDTKREDAELFWGALQSRKTCQEEESHTHSSVSSPACSPFPFFPPAGCQTSFPSSCDHPGAFHSPGSRWGQAQLGTE